MFDKLDMPQKGHQAVDLRGQSFGRLTVIEFAGVRRGPSGNTKRFWQCRCQCGTELPIRGDQLVRGVAQSCGCLYRETRPKRSPARMKRERQRELFLAERAAKGFPTAPNFVNLVGKNFGRLTVVDFDGVFDQHGHWLCYCECGEETIVTSDKLNNGHTQSCGCLSRDNPANPPHLRNRKHGHAGRRDYDGGLHSPTYITWQAMMTRCYCSSHPRYEKYYGGKGITVCDRWRGEHGFINFLADMGLRPAGKTIHRINSNKDYTKANCRWATPEEQAAERG